MLTPQAMLAPPSPCLVRAAVLVALALGACRGSSDSVMPPVPLSEDAPAQAEYRTLRAQFFDADGAERAKLAGKLSEFLVRFPSDPRTFDIEVYLVWARLESGDRAGARALLEPLLKGESGPRLDFARVAAATILARSGEARHALSEFDLLEGKLVDLDERFVYGEERAHCAFLAGAYERAAEALLAWLVQAPLDRQSRARNTATHLLDLAPNAELVHALAVLRRPTGGSTSPDLEMARGWLASTIAKKLSDLALARGDAELARRLLEAAPAALRATPEGQRLVALAAGAPKGPAVAGRALGLLLSLTGPVEQRRASAAAAGITRALGSAHSTENGHGVDVLVRYDTEDVDTALEALAADGAALFVAGNDDETARRASARAEALHIPLLLLRPLERPPAAQGFTFVLGADDTAAEQALVRALAERGKQELGQVGPGGTPCSVEPTSPGKPRFPLATWKHDRVDALLVLGDADCARDVASELVTSRDRLTLALGLDAGGVGATLGVPTLTPGAGKYPSANTPAGGWYEALGHDAAVLAARALQALPSEGVARQADVQALHARARDALATVEADLWTSDDKSFRGARVLGREITIVSGGPAPR